LSKAQEAIEAKRYGEAYWILDEALDEPKLNAFERAILWQTMAYLHAEQENIAAAIKAFVRSTEVRKADGSLGLPKAQWLSTIYNIGQLYMMVEQYAKAAQFLDMWLAEGGAPRTQALALLATARFQLREFDKALVAIDEAMAASPTPNEKWSKLKAAIEEGLAVGPPR
jgi:tetratricopeptide (TPR) repeat protein